MLSEIKTLLTMMISLRGLNPYCNGRCSQSAYGYIGHAKLSFVLILIVMEDALRVESHLLYNRVIPVLILIVMEDALRGQKYITSDNERITDLYYNLFTKFY